MDIKQIAEAPGRVWRFYRDGFRGMTSTGRTLWVVIIVKLIIIFAVLKLFFFRDAMAGLDTDAERASAVRTAIVNTP